MAPNVLTPSRAPEPRPACSASSASSADEAGKAIPSISVTGSTVSREEPNSALSVSSGLPGVGTCGATRTSTRPAMARPAAAIWLAASRRIGSPIRARTAAKTTAPRAIPIRKVVRIVVKT